MPNDLMSDKDAATAALWIADELLRKQCNTGRYPRTMEHLQRAISALDNEWNATNVTTGGTDYGTIDLRDEVRPVPEPFVRRS